MQSAANGFGFGILEKMEDVEIASLNIASSKSNSWPRNWSEISTVFLFRLSSATAFIMGIFLVTIKSPAAKYAEY